MRAPCVDKNGMKKGAWSEEEDNKLRAYVLRYGHWNWRLLPKFAGLDRCGKSCRLRWVNYLKPGIKRGSYSKEEEALIAKLHDELGNKWSAIAAKVPGRTDNEIKNYWHTHLRKRSAKRIPSPHSLDQITAGSNNSQEASLTFLGSEIPILESSVSDSWNRCRVNWDSEDSASSSHSAGEIQTSFWSELEPLLAETANSPPIRSSSHSAGGIQTSFWSELEPLLAETANSPPIRSPSHSAGELQTSFWTELDPFLAETTNSPPIRSSDSSFDGFEESFWTEPFLVDTSYSQNDIFSPFENGDFFFDNLFT